MATSFLDTPIGKHARRMAELKGQEPRVFKLVLDNNFIRNLIIHMNTDDQLGTDHIDSVGHPLFSKFNDRGYYSKLTEQLTGGLKKAGEKYNLNLTGEFWESFRVSVGTNSIEITANPVKPETNLFDEYGEKIVGLTESNMEILRNEAKALFIEFFRSFIVQN